MSKPHRVIPIVKASAAAAKPRVHYDCLKCPGYCCSYDLIEVGKRDVARLENLELDYQQAEDRFTKFDRDEKGAHAAPSEGRAVRQDLHVLRHQEAAVHQYTKRGRAFAAIIPRNRAAAISIF